MISERAICELLSNMLPCGRQNACFESDSEVLSLNGTPCLFTTDEFSDEDLFRTDDPYLLGWNIATGAMSDIYACGGTPLFYAHALTVDRRWDTEYLTHFGQGVRDVLVATGARFIGGDCGRADQWRCTVSVLGGCENVPVLRRGATPGDLIYISGKIGSGNLEAALRLQDSRSRPNSIKNQFALRQRESGIMRKYASACIDTSDGLASGLNTLADLNGCGYAVADLPYCEAGLHFCAAAHLPTMLLFLGECGEYELLFTLKPERESAFLAEALESNCTFYRLGTMTTAGRMLHEAGRSLDLGSLRMQARDYDAPQQYLSQLLSWLAKQGQPQGPTLQQRS